jgi:hypothetical protein
MLAQALAACPNGEDASRSLLWLMWNRPWYREYMREAVSPLESVGGPFGHATDADRPTRYTDTGRPLRLVGGAA